MNLIFHIIINLLFGAALEFNHLEILAFVLGGALIDLDHIIYQYFVIGNKSLGRMQEWHTKEFAVRSFHYFPLHFLELGIVFGLIFYFLNWYVALFFFGMALHVLTDLIEHVIFHRSLEAFRYYTFTGFLFSKITQ